MDEEPSKPGLTQRLEEGRRTFQPGLWSRLVVIGAIGIYVLFFVVLNTRDVKLSLVFGTTHVSLIWAILLPLAAGIAIGVLLSQMHRRRGRS